MSFAELTWARKSIRRYTDQDISTESLMKLLDAARSAPSAGNKQPWFFYVIKDAALKKQLCQSTGNRQPFILDAPVHIVVCADLPRTAAKYGERGMSLYCLQDTAAAIQNLQLCAEEEGIGVCWLGAFDEEIVSKVLNLTQDFRPIALLSLGYPAGDSPKTKRRPISEIAAFIGFDGEELAQSEAQSVELAPVALGRPRIDNMDMPNSDLVKMNMQGCEFSEVNLAGASFKNCDLTGLTLSDCRVEGLSVNGKTVL